MITFTSKSLNEDELKATVQEAFIQCISNALDPLGGKYGSEYDEYETKEEKHRKFAEDTFELMIEISVLDDGLVQVNDDLHDEGYRAQDQLRLENVVHYVKTKCPDLSVEGEGEIDYGNSVPAYTITTDGNSIHVEVVDEDWNEVYFAGDIDENGIHEIELEDEEDDEF